VRPFCMNGRIHSGTSSSQKCHWFMGGSEGTRGGASTRRSHYPIRYAGRRAANPYVHDCLPGNETNRGFVASFIVKRERALIPFCSAARAGSWATGQGPGVIWPLRIMYATSILSSVAQADGKDLKPSISLTRFVMVRWPCSTMFFRYLIRTTSIGIRQPKLRNIRLMAVIPAVLAPLRSMTILPSRPFTSRARAKSLATAGLLRR
jgi:hypothetical protein